MKDAFRAYAEDLNEMKTTIEKAAFDLFLKYGPRRVTIDDIVAATPISRKMFYELYSNKEMLIQAMSDRFLLEGAEEIREEMEKQETPLWALIRIQQIFFNNIRRLSTSFIYEIKKYFPETAQDYNEFKQRSLFAAMTALLNKASGLGQVRTGVDISRFCRIQVYCLEEILFGRLDLINHGSDEETTLMGSDIIINNTRGIISSRYMDQYDQLMKTI